MKRNLLLATCVGIGIVAVLCAPLSAQTLEISPKKIMVDEIATIRATGLNPNEAISIQGELIDGRDHRWTSEAKFIADSSGTVDVSKQAPVKGSYKEVSAMGLVWAMKPAESHVVVYQSPPDLGAQTIQFHLIRDGKAVASAQLEQLQVADGVRRVNVNGKLHGVLFLPADSGRHPGVLVLGGSEGGLHPQRAAWLASHGYVALALAYFHYEDLPQELDGIPLEYFGTALAWLRERPEVLPDRIAVMGASRGGELALQLGSMYSQIAAVVAFVPANVRYPACCDNTRFPYAWTWKGEPLAYVPRRTLRRPDPLIAMQAAIAVEQTHGPILLIAGQDDGVWDSPAMTAAVASRLKDKHFPARVERLNYPHAGHRAGRPEIVPEWHGEMRHPVSGREMNPGGTPEGDAESSLDAIPKLLTFLRESLGVETPAAPSN